jgi:aspartyl-tRNA(Asn)/glutamyl-tRNA(Gln) amidotransferase subunit A
MATENLLNAGGRLSSLVEVARQVSEGKTSAHDAVNACLARIDALDEDVKAFVQVDADSALRTAAYQSALRAEERAELPLAGIAVGIKDIIDVAGLPTRCGSDLRTNHVALADAPIVAALRELGAVIVGKTVTTQFATSDPSKTHNPWNLAHSPGGSSAGSAAATACGMVFAALGTQTGGSITRPASFCGVASYKGQRGNWPLAGIVPVGENLDHVGPMGRQVADVALLWALVESRLAPATRGRRLAQARSIIGDTWLDRMSPPRLAVFDGYFDTASESSAYAGFAKAVQQLESAGAVIDEIGLPASFEGMHAAHRCVMAAEAASVHHRDYERAPQTYGSNLSFLIEEGLAIGAVTYRDALAHQGRFATELREVMAAGGSSGLVLAPASTSAAPALTENSTGDAQFNVVFSFSGLPSCGFPSMLNDDGLPLGLQVGATHESFAQFQASAWCERVLGFPGFTAGD